MTTGNLTDLFEEIVLITNSTFVVFWPFVLDKTLRVRVKCP